jgi:hypothetical protein
MVLETLSVELLGFLLSLLPAATTFGAPTRLALFTAASIFSLIVSLSSGLIVEVGANELELVADLPLLGLAVEVSVSTAMVTEEDGTVAEIDSVAADDEDCAGSTGIDDSVL